MIKLINSVFKIFKAQNKKEKYNYGRNEVRRDAEKQRKDRAEVYVDSRTVDGDRRVSQAREGASVGEQISFIDGTKGATKQIRTRSGRISDVSQLSEIYGASRENDIGRELIALQERITKFKDERTAAFRFPKNLTFQERVTTARMYWSETEHLVFSELIVPFAMDDDC